jgi:hypothetical protein
MRAACLALAALTALEARASSLERALELARERRFAEALAEARAEPDALRRAQAELYVLHHAGDLEGALAAGRAGLRAAPDDPWLRERCAYVALSLRAHGPAREHADALARVARAGTDDAALAARYRAEADALAATAARAGAALTRARITVLAGAALALAAWLALARSPRHRDATRSQASKGSRPARRGLAGRQVP